MNIQKMMQQAQAMQTKMQAELAATRIEASSGGGMVTIEMSGAKEVLSVKIDKAAVDPADVETLQDLIRAAFSDALTKSRELAANRLGSVTGGLKIPGM